MVVVMYGERGKWISCNQSVIIMKLSYTSMTKNDKFMTIMTPLHRDYHSDIGIFTKNKFPNVCALN